MKKMRFIPAIIFWVLTIGTMIIIFSFSAENGEESKELSQSFLDVIINYIGKFISHNTLRKLAHFSEYAFLGFSITGALYFSFDKKFFLKPLVFCMLYSISDEVHQYFVPDRACRIFDVGVDTLGSILGISIIILFINFLIKIKNKNKWR